MEVTKYPTLIPTRFYDVVENPIIDRNTNTIINRFDIANKLDHIPIIIEE